MADVYSLPLFVSESLVGASTVNREVIPLKNYKLKLGKFATQLDVAGLGSVDVTLYLSLNDGLSFVASTDLLWQNKDSGSFISSHTVEAATHFYVSATSDDSCDVSLWMTLQ